MIDYYTAHNMHVYVILAEEHKPIFSIFNHHQQDYVAVVFQIPLLHKAENRYRQSWQTYCFRK